MSIDGGVFFFFFLCHQCSWRFVFMWILDIRCREPVHRFFQLKYEQSCFKWVNAPHSAFCITQMYLFTSQSKKKKFNKNKLSVPICILCHSTDQCFRSVSDQILDYGDRPVMYSFLVDFISQQSTGAKKKKKLAVQWGKGQTAYKKLQKETLVSNNSKNVQSFI